MKIEPKDIGTYEVESRSRPGENHVVDVAALTCSCEGFQNYGACAHLQGVLASLLSAAGVTFARPRSGSALLLTRLHKCPHGIRRGDICLLC